MDSINHKPVAWGVIVFLQMEYKKKHLNIKEAAETRAQQKQD